MPHLNIEIKARCSKPDFVRQQLREKKADFKGRDHQIDTYFKVPQGRLKLRAGNIENSLIYYERSDTATPKASHVNLARLTGNEGVKDVLQGALGIKVVVDKQREIYFIDNVKFHVDEVQTLGSFVEIEAIDIDGNIGEAKLHEQCAYYMNLLQIQKTDLMHCSYSDLLSRDVL